MKKIYTAPLTQVVKTKTTQIICASPVSFEGNSGSATLNSATASGNALDKDYDEDFIDDLW